MKLTQPLYHLKFKMNQILGAYNYEIQSRENKKNMIADILLGYH